jgi:MYXO-CTERM domain-containing protein
VSIGAAGGTTAILGAHAGQFFADRVDVGGDAGGSLGPAALEVWAGVAGNSMEVTNTVTVWNDQSAIEFDSGTFRVGAIALLNGGHFYWGGGQLELTKSVLNVTPGGLLGGDVELSNIRSLKAKVTVGGAGGAGGAGTLTVRPSGQPGFPTSLVLATLPELTTSSNGAFVVDGGKAVVTAAHNAGAIRVKSGGTLTATDVDGAGLLEVDGGTAGVTSVLNDGTIRVAGAGAVTLGTADGAGAVDVVDGALSAKSIRQRSLRAGGTGANVTLTADGGTSVLKALDLAKAGGAGPATFGGKLDLTNNALVVDYDAAAATPAADIVAAVLQGRNLTGARWQGRGITSSTAAADSTRAVGAGEASDLLGLSGAQTASFAGQTVDATAVLVRLVTLGDLDLSGGVGRPDFERIRDRYAAAGGWFPGGWPAGDLNFDGSVDLADWRLFKPRFGTGAVVTAQDLADVQAFNNLVDPPPTPEPSAIGVLGATALLGRRRRRRSSTGSPPHH